MDLGVVGHTSTSAGAAGDAGRPEPWLVAEATVEPFVPGRRGPHVEALAEAARRCGVGLSVGPFGDQVEGPVEAVAEALRQGIQAAFAAGATRLTLQVTALPGGLAGPPADT